MPTFRYLAEIFAPPEKVWEVLVDLEHWHQWTPTVTRVERLEAGPLAIGGRARIWQPKLMTTVWRVTVLDENAGLFIWQTGRPGIRITASHHVEHAAGGSTRLTLTLDYGGILGPLMAWQLKKLNWDYLTKEAQGLKRRCEGETF